MIRKLWKREPAAVSGKRRALVDEIDHEMRDTASLTGRAALAPAVRRALIEVPREEFVAAEDKALAYLNRPLSVGHGQTISQPYIVALMTELLDPVPDDTVLEIGTGSGYQAAVLARIVRRVYTVEIVPELAAAARARFARLGIGTVEVRAGDGAGGWPGHAPYDSIIVTAAVPTVPPALLAQLKSGGRMVVPIGQPFGQQNLVVIAKDENGETGERPVLPVAFVPFTGAG